MSICSDYNTVKTLLYTYMCRRHDMIVEKKTEEEEEKKDVSECSFLGEHVNMCLFFFKLFFCGRKRNSQPCIVYVCF